MFAILAILVMPLLALPLLGPFVLPLLSRIFGSVFGWYLAKKTQGRRAQLLALMDEDEEKYQQEKRSEGAREGEDGWEDIEYPAGSSKNGEKDTGAWTGIVGFFHPFCNAGGGGERVLWAAVRATQQRWPRARCIIYTGDHEMSKEAMLSRVKNRFNIPLHAPTITFIYLATRHWVLASTWPRFTLVGQSIGSMVMAWDALSLVVPDVFVDTMGYAFALGLCKFLLRKVPTCAYVHYPTISTDMLNSLEPSSSAKGVNAGKGAGAVGRVKKLYWKLFAALYSRMGSSIDVVMTNSSWTQSHIQTLWGPHRSRRAAPISVVYPPVAVRELEREIDVSSAAETTKRRKDLLYIAQFRPEKDHDLILTAFGEFAKSKSPASQGARLILVGSVRDDDDKKRVYQLRLLAYELGIQNEVEFRIDVAWPEILEWLQTSSVGVNGMWNEHFGIGVVEYQAAGLISVVHNSGGPKMDIVTEVDGGPTGFHASTSHEFAAAFQKAISLPDPLAWRQRARMSARRFTEEEFAKRWTAEMERLVDMAK